MARRTTDLLDVFRAERRPADGGAAKPAAKAARERRAFEGLLLLPRQLLLGGSVLVLLLVFAFVFGLSVGRRGAPDDAALSAQTQRAAESNAKRVFVVGRVPLVDPVRQTANEPIRIYSDLVKAKNVPGELVWIQDDPSHQHLLVLLGPFADKAQAMDYMVRASLVTARLGGAQVFHAPEYRWLAPRDLPAQRVPAR